jgi:hypothetical protein
MRLESLGARSIRGTLNVLPLQAAHLEDFMPSLFLICTLGEEVSDETDSETFGLFVFQKLFDRQCETCAEVVFEA